jgi:hypothetical protein
LFSPWLQQELTMKSCWQIRQEESKTGNGWRIGCPECHAFAAGVSCWELNAPCCCAPVHVTCDFCSLYISHRREITNRGLDGGAGGPAGPGEMQGWSTG